MNILYNKQIKQRIQTMSRNNRYTFSRNKMKTEDKYRQPAPKTRDYSKNRELGRQQVVQRYLRQKKEEQKPPYKLDPNYYPNKQLNYQRNKKVGLQKHHLDFYAKNREDKKLAINQENIVKKFQDKTPIYNKTSQEYIQQAVIQKVFGIRYIEDLGYIPIENTRTLPLKIIDKLRGLWQNYADRRYQQDQKIMKDQSESTHAFMKCLSLANIRISKQEQSKLATKQKFNIIYQFLAEQKQQYKKNTSPEVNRKKDTNQRKYNGRSSNDTKNQQIFKRSQQQQQSSLQEDEVSFYDQYNPQKARKKAQISDNKNQSADKKQLQLNYQNLINKLKKIQFQNNSLKEKITQLQYQRKKLQSRIEKLKPADNIYNEQNTNIISDLQQKVQNINARYLEQKNKVNQLRIKSNQLQQINKDSQDKISCLSQKLNQQKSQKRELITINNNLSQALQKIQKQIQKKQAKFTQNGYQAKLAQQQYIKIKGQLQKKQLQILSAKQSVQKLTADLATEKQQKKIYQKKLQILSQSAQQLNSKNNMSFQKQQKLNNQLQFITKKIQKQQQTNLSLKKQIESLLKNKDAEINNLKKLQENLIRQKAVQADQYAKYAKKCEEKEVLYQQSQKQNERLRIQLAIIQERHSKTKHELLKRQQEIQVIKNKQGSYDQSKMMQPKEGTDQSFQRIHHLKEQIAELYIDRLFSAGNLLEKYKTAKIYLRDLIEQNMKNKITKTELLFKYDEINPSQNFHSYVDGHPNICLIIHLANGEFIGAFSESRIQKQQREKDKMGILFSITKNRYFLMKKNPAYSPTQFDPYHIVIGNGQLRIKWGDKTKKVSSIFGTAQNFFNNEGFTHEFLLGTKERQTQFISYEIYQIKF